MPVPEEEDPMLKGKSSALARQLHALLVTLPAHLFNALRASSIRDAVGAIITVASVIFAVLSWQAADRSANLASAALRFANETRTSDSLNAVNEAARNQRDAQLGMKLDLYAKYAQGSIEALREMTFELSKKESPFGLLADSTLHSLFGSYIYDVELGVRTVSRCVSQMHNPQRHDIKCKYSLENEYWRLRNKEYQILSLLGIEAAAISDSAARKVTTGLDYESDHITVMPLPSTEIAMPLRVALDNAPDRKRGKPLRVQRGPKLTQTRFLFRTPDGEYLTPGSGIEGHQSAFLGKFRVGVGMDTEAFDIYYYWDQPDNQLIFKPRNREISRSALIDYLKEAASLPR